MAIKNPSDKKQNNEEMGGLMDALNEIVQSDAPDVSDGGDAAADAPKASASDSGDGDDSGMDSGILTKPKVKPAVDLDSLTGEEDDGDDDDTDGDDDTEEGEDDADDEDSGAEGEPEEDLEDSEEDPPVQEEKQEDISQLTNLARLRKIAETERKKSKELEARLKQELEEKYQTEITTLKSEVEKKKPLEDLVGMISSEEWNQKYVEPQQKDVNNLVAILKDYGQDPAQIAPRLLQAGSRKVLNELLNEVVEDMDGREEIRRVVSSIQARNFEMNEAQKKPGEAFKNLMLESQSRRLKEKEDKEKKIAEASTVGWSQALKLNTTGDLGLVELKEVVGNIAHNEQTVKPLLRDSKKLYDQIVNTIGAKGADVDAASAGTLASLCQLAVAAHTIAQGRDRYYKLWKEERRLRKIEESDERPSLTGRRGGVRKAMDVEDPSLAAFNEAGQELLTSKR